MLKRRMRATLLAAAVAIAAVGVGLYWSSEARADNPVTMQVAIPNNVVIVGGTHRIIFIGRPSSASTNNCAPGTPQAQSVVVTDPGGGSASQITGIVAFHDHEIANGQRFKVTVDPPSGCGDLRVYTVTPD